MKTRMVEQHVQDQNSKQIFTYITKKWVPINNGNLIVLLNKSDFVQCH